MAVVKRRQQKLKYYRYCLRKARELMRSELRKCEVLAGRMKKMDAKQIGEVIKEARKRKKMTQKQLGAVLGVATLTIWRYENGVYEVISFEKRAKMSSVLNIPMSELMYDNEKIACISTNEAVDELKEQEKLIKAVNAALEEWLYSGDTDYLYKAMAVIRAAIGG